MIFDKETGIVVLETGEPAGPDGVESFLRQVLSDEEANPLSFLKRPFRRLVVETTVANEIEDYQRDFADIGVDSPLHRVCGGQADGIAEILGCEGYVMMHHGEPSPKTTIELMVQEGIKRAIVIPMDPHPSAQSLSATFDSFAAAFAEATSGGESLLIDDWAKEPQLRQVMVQHYAETTSRLPEDAEVVFLARDPGLGVVKSDSKHRRKVEERFNELCNDLQLGSRGVLAWLPAMFSASGIKPSALDVIEKIGKSSAKWISLVPFGWTSDRFETLCGVDMKCGRAVRAHKLRLFRLPTINDRPEFLVAMAALINRRGKGQAA